LANKQWRITGSAACYHWFPDSRVPGDIDILTPARITSQNTDVCFVDPQWNNAAAEIIRKNKDPVFVDPDSLLTIKVSHAHWNIKWQKTLFDVDFLQSKGAKFDLELYNLLVLCWEQIHGKKQVNLNQPVAEFFQDAVVRKYDHEILHQLVAFGDRPMHERIRKDLNNAFCDENLFLQLSPQEQLQTAMEEMLVTAIERNSITENSSSFDRIVAVNSALKLLIVSMTKGWFGRFLIFNHRELLSRRKTEWQKKLNSALIQLNNLS
jgi:hypothetical protein